MIEYVVADNPDDRVLRRASKLLNDGGVICFPTDTNWVLAASPNSKKGVESLYKIKEVHGHKEQHFSLICNNISEASRFCMISDFSYKKIKRRLPGAYTFIFYPMKDLPKGIKAYHKEKQIGFRIPDSTLCHRLVDFHEGPLITTSVTHAMLGLNEEDEVYSYQVEMSLEHQLKMILDPGEFVLEGPSSVIDFSSDDVPVILREGVGDTSFFQS